MQQTLNYASEVWGFHKATSVETVHLQFCKKVLGVKQSTQNVISSAGRNQIHKINLYNDVNDLETKPLKLNLVLSVKHVWCKLGFMQAWTFQEVGNEQRFVDLFKTRVEDIFMHDWHARFESSTRARLNNTFANFRYQNYLDDIKVERFRTSLSKLRLSSHRLEVEVGR